MQGLFEAVNGHVAAVGMRIDVPKTKVMSALIPGEQHQVVLLDYGPLEEVDQFKHFGSMFVKHEEIRSRINLARSAFSRLQSCLWSRRVQIVESTRQRCDRLCSTFARHG